MSFVPLRVSGSLLKNRSFHWGLQAAVLLLSASLNAEAQPTMGPSDAIGVDYPEAWFNEYAIDRFEVQYDARGWTSVGIPPVYTALDGVTTYTVTPDTPAGSHTVSFRACNADACSASTSPFAFVVPGDTSVVPGDTSVVPGEAPPDPGRVVQLQAAHTANSCLDISGASTENGARLIQWQCHGGDNQTWSIEAMGDGYSRLVSRQSGKCLDVSGESTADGAPVLQWQCHNGANQQWRVEPVGEGYRFVARHSGKCLDVPGWSTNDGTAMTQWQCQGGANQTWLVRER